MTTPTASPTDLDMPLTESVPVCECPCHERRGEAIPRADLRIKIHKGRPGDLYSCDDTAVLLCEHCFEVIRAQAEHVLSMAIAGHIHCACGRTLSQVSDIILAVIRL